MIDNGNKDQAIAKQVTEIEGLRTQINKLKSSTSRNTSTPDGSAMLQSFEVIDSQDSG